MNKSRKLLDLIERTQVGKVTGAKYGQHPGEPITTFKKKDKLREPSSQAKKMLPTGKWKSKEIPPEAKKWPGWSRKPFTWLAPVDRDPC